MVRHTHTHTLEADFLRREKERKKGARLGSNYKQITAWTCEHTPPKEGKEEDGATVAANGNDCCSRPWQRQAENYRY